MANPLLRTKSIERILADSDAPEHRLKRTLTAWDLTGLGIGAIIGTGIFVLIGTAIVGDAHRPGAGPGIVLSFILSGITCALAALCYAEFAAMIPVAGSAYTYSYATLGEFLAWLTGWNLILEYGVACVAVAIGWSGYFNNILKLCGIELPYWATHAPGSDGGLVNLPAAIIVLLVTGILIVGVKESARATCTIVLVKLAVIVFFITVGMSSVDTANWSPFMPFGFAGVGAAAAIVFFAYIGFDAVSTTAEEAKNPQRDLPIGIFASLGICTLLYISVAAVLTGLVPYAKIDIHAPVAEGLRVAGFQWGAAVVATGAVAGITSVLVVMMIGQIRVFFAMSRDGLLGPWLSGVHPTFRTPHHATYLTGVAVAIMAALIPIGEAADMTNIGTLFAFVLVCIGIVVLRYTKPNHPRPFRMPLMPVVPILGVLACLGLMYFLPWMTWIRFFVWTAIGVAVYLVYGMRHSKLAALPTMKEKSISKQAETVQ
ncbi:MAG: putative amino acid permease YhdG [Nitrospirae bacterium]|nr:MAG: amino acid permease [Nitrospira sp. OLB3]MBV6469005.1 putative amino acid permease YhdG [Nitrospirota bacterium]MEB2338161.1 amino acid permease [Nitrospirales bacterium]